MNDFASMSQTATGMGSISKAYQSLLTNRPGMLASEIGGELSWLKRARERDALRWMSEGLPNRASERWHYTSLGMIHDSEVVLAGSSVAQRNENFSNTYVKAFAEVVFLNGHFCREMSRLPKGMEAQVSIDLLSELFEECVNNGWSPERMKSFSAFRAHIETSDADRETVFAAMNTSCMQDAVLIHVRSDVSIEEPIVVKYLSSAESASTGLPMSSPRIFAHLNSHASAAIIEIHEGSESSGRYMSNAVSDLRLEESARLTHCKVQLESASAVHFGTTRIHQKRDSFSETSQFSFGGKLARQDLHISLEGQGAEAVLDGLYMVSEKQHTDHYTLVDHAVPHTTSDQLYKGILDQEARAVFNGHVKIKRDAQKSDAGQKNHNLVLSRKAEVDTKPELEIDADDVKASHGASIGQLDPEHVFYFQARGIAKDEAISLIARGFAMDVVFRIKNKAVRESLAEIVSQRFDSMKIGGLDGL